MLNRDFINSHKKELAARRAAGDFGANPLGAPADWHKRKTFARSEQLSERSPLADLKEAITGFDEETCIKAICLLADRTDAESIDILKTLAENRPLFIPNGDAVIPSYWMVQVAEQRFLESPVAMATLLDAIQTGKATDRDVELATAKEDDDRRLTWPVEDALIHVVCQGLSQKWVYKEEKSWHEEVGECVLCRWWAPDPEDPNAQLSMAQIATALKALGKGKSEESFTMLTTLALSSPQFGRDARVGLEIRKEEDDLVADFLVAEQKMERPGWVYDFCTPEEARAYLRSYGGEEAGMRTRAALEKKYDKDLYRALKERRVREGAEQKAAEKQSQQAQRANPMGWTQQHMTFTGKVAGKPEWMEWIHQKLLPRIPGTGIIFVLGWVALFEYVFALHTIPVLELLDRLTARFRLSRMEYDARRRGPRRPGLWADAAAFREGPWFGPYSCSDLDVNLRYSDRWKNSLHHNPLLATLIAIPAFLITSPLTVISLPVAFWKITHPLSRDSRRPLFSFPMDAYQRTTIAWGIFKWVTILVVGATTLAIGIVCYQVIKVF